MSTPINRWSLDLERWRAFRWLLIKQEEDYKSFLYSKASVMVIRGDSAEFQLWPSRNKACVQDVFARCVTVYGKDSSQCEIRPRFNRVSCKSYRGIVGSLDLDGLGIREWAKSSAGIKMIFCVVDNHSANRLAVKHLVQLFSSEPNILIGTIICLAHVLSNSAKRGNILRPIGAVLRLSHYLRCRPIRDLGIFVDRMLSDAAVTPSDCFIGKAELLFSE